MATYVIFREDVNGMLRSRSTSWLPARAGTGTMFSPTQFYDTNTTWIVNTEEWNIQQVFFAFDTSVIGSNDKVVSAHYRLHATTQGSDSSWSLQLRDKTDWTPGSLTTGDFVPGASLSSIPLIRSHTVTNSPGAVIGPINIDVNGYTKFFTSTSLQQNSAEPAKGVNTFTSGSFTTRQLLIVHTTPPSTLLGLAEAAVQLSDGSTVYLESDGASSPTVTMKRVDTAGDVTTIDTVPTDPNETHALKVEGLQSLALLCDANDNLFVIGARGNHTSNVGRFAWENTGPGTWGTRSDINTTDSGVTEPIGISAVWCDGTANGGAGRILVIYGSKGDGTTGYILFNASLSGGLTGIDSDTHPSWLVSSSAYRNTSGMGFSITTDVFGGNRVGVFSSSNNALTSAAATVTHSTRAAAMTVGSTISNITQYTWGATSSPGAPSFDPQGNRAKVLGTGTNSFVGIFHSPTTLNARRLGGANVTTTRADSFDAVYDANTGIVWAYFWDEGDNTKLMRRPFVSDSWGTPVEVGTFTGFPGSGTRNSIRTVKQLRAPHSVEVHWNRIA